MDVSWRDYIDRIFDLKEAAHRAEMEAAQRALSSASEALKYRLNAMEQANYVTRSQFEPLREAIDKRLSELEKRSANQDGRLWAVGVGLTVGLSLLTIVLNMALRWLQ